MVLKAARRYANAFLQLAIEKDSLDSLLDDVHTIHSTIEASRELKLFLKSPIIKPEDKRNALHSVFKDQVDPVTIQFLDLIIRKGREKLIEQIMESFIDLYKRHAGILDINVYSAMSLPDETRDRMNQALEKTTEMDVELKVETNPDLLGGIAVRIEDTVIDGTVKHKIEQLRTLFKEASIRIN